jgi:Tol biopolymer transport system component
VSLVHGAALEAWSPDGRWLAISGDEGSDSAEHPVSGDNTVKLVSPNSSDRKPIPVPRTAPVGDLAWGKDGHLHYLTRPPAGERGIFATSVRPNGEGLVQVPLSVPVLGAAWAPRGWPLAFVPNSNTFDIEKGRLGPQPGLWILDRPGSRPRRLLSLAGEESAPAFSSDGSKVLFRVKGKRVDVWTVNRDGTHPRELVPGLVDASASWSPDGKQVALAAVTEHGDRRYHLFEVSAQGGPIRQVSDKEVAADPPAWTPDGKWLTYATGAGEIARVRPDGTGTEVIAQFSDEEVGDLLWSPDGQHLAYTSRPARPET